MMHHRCICWFLSICFKHVEVLNVFFLRFFSPMIIVIIRNNMFLSLQDKDLDSSA